MFLAQLNLSKHHTPSCAVKRADRETTESQMRKCHLLLEFLWKKSSQSSEKREWGTERADGVKGRERWKPQCVVNSALSFSCYWNSPRLNDWVNRQEKSLFSIKTQVWRIDKKQIKVQRQTDSFVWAAAVDCIMKCSLWRNSWNGKYSLKVCRKHGCDVTSKVP